MSSPNNTTPARYQPDTLTHGPQTATQYRSEIAYLLGFDRQRIPGSFPSPILRAIYHALCGSPAPRNKTLPELRVAIARELNIGDPARFQSGSTSFRKADTVVIYNRLQALDEDTLLEVTTTCPECDHPITTTHDHGETVSIADAERADDACFGVKDGSIVEYIHRD